MEKFDNLYLENQRFKQMLELLPLLRKINANSIEELFFHDFRGPFSIQVLIECIYNQ